MLTDYGASKNNQPNLVMLRRKGETREVPLALLLHFAHVERSFNLTYLVYIYMFTLYTLPFSSLNGCNTFNFLK